MDTTQLSPPALGSASRPEAVVWARQPDWNAYQRDPSLLLQRAESPRQVWGVYSQQAGTKRSPLPRPADPPAWQVPLAAVVVLCFYCYLLFRFRPHILLCLKNMGSAQKELSLQQGYGVDFARFRWLSAGLAALGLSTFMIAWLDRQVEVDKALLFGGVLGVVVAIGIYRRLAIQLIGWGADDRTLARDLRFLNQLDFVILGLFYTLPAMLIGLGGRLFTAGFVLLGLLLCYHYQILFQYFSSRSFSKLHWFLYLCAVEFLPISFVVAWALRGGAL